MNKPLPEHLYEMANRTYLANENKTMDGYHLNFIWTNMDYFPHTIYPPNRENVLMLAYKNYSLDDMVVRLVGNTNFVFSNGKSSFIHRATEEEKQKLFDSVANWFEEYYKLIFIVNNTVSFNDNFSNILFLLFGLIKPDEQKKYMENTKTLYEYLSNSANSVVIKFYQAIRPEILSYAYDKLNKVGIFKDVKFSSNYYVGKNTHISPYYVKTIDVETIKFLTGVVKSNITDISESLGRYPILAEDVLSTFEYMDRIPQDELMRNANFPLRGRYLDFIDPKKLNPNRWIRWTYLPVEFIERFPGLITKPHFKKYSGYNFFSSGALRILSPIHGERYKTRRVMPEESYSHRRIGIREYFDEIVPDLSEDGFRRTLSKRDKFSNAELRSRLIDVAKIIGV